MSVFTDRLEQAFRDTLSYTIGAPEHLDFRWSELLGNVLAKGVVVVVLVGVFSLLYWLLRTGLKWCEKRFNLAHEWIDAFKNALKFFWLLACLIAVLSQCGMTPETLQATARASIAGLVFYILWKVSSRFMGRALGRFNLDASIEQLLKNLLSVLIVVLGIAAVMAQFGFNILSIIAGLGIVGLAVGFAAQSTLSNFIAGITILLERPFRIGDWVRINDQEGKIIKIALRTTHIKTRDNISIIIPNATVASADLTNLTARDLIRFSVFCQIAYKESIAQAREVILTRLDGIEDILHTPAPLVNARELADSGVTLVIRYWLNPVQVERQPRISEMLLEEIKSALDAASIEIPFPHVQLMYNPADNQPTNQSASTATSKPTIID